MSSAAGLEGERIRPSAARERLLTTASELFYREGIGRVGMDRVLSEAGVPRATMYRHFSGKEALVAACLEREDERVRAALTASPDPDADRLLVLIADDLTGRHSRGCPFINAAIEYPDPASEVRRIVAAHRAWFVELIERALGSSSPASDLAAEIVLLRDGALVGGYLDEPDAVRAAFLRAARALIDPAR
ncbi:TetR/AcrR family transcriptional regulator [Herbiconiux sp. CPCC 203407]|uniref:TetR/AcrR family transcriptional regulator n=1 Tax=Herbiconiux oxytropis TaxID=2970915 RepID=A0AA41XFF1_9MICO|nr:TetR/AcrR family transcriptional regulator [Herbiconiux oxytropis]MCS5721046.1 TetR/AcrR family transcriptional regulator [Herbiconiux oxytropis]MCS5724698.1 TetR/AcrR family transcriptional regulator [Herbiconiux oxytropis]